jgi:hypothetical protein
MPETTDAADGDLHLPCKHIGKQIRSDSMVNGFSELFLKQFHAFLHCVR